MGISMLFDSSIRFPQHIHSYAVGVTDARTLGDYRGLQVPSKSDSTSRSDAGKSIAEAVGVLVVLCLLQFGSYGIDHDLTKYHQGWALRFTMAMILVSTVVGTLAEIVSCFSRSCADRLPYLGAFGKVLIWLGSALEE